MADEKTIFYTGPLWIYIKESDNSIELVDHYRPMYPYGNYVKTVIKLNLEDNTLRCYIVHDSWGGTGSKDCGVIVLSEDEKNKVLELMRNVKSPEDFDELVELFNELKSKREERASQLFDEVVEALVELVAEDERIRSLRMIKEELQEKAREFVEYLISE